MMYFDEDHPLYATMMEGMQRHSELRYPPMRGWVVPGLMACGEVTAIFGKPQQGKSLIALDIACRVAAGLDWEGNSTEYRRPVLYIASERPDQIRRRVSAFCREHNIEPLDNLLIYSGALDLAADDHNQLEAAILATSHVLRDDWADVVFVDTLQMAMSRPVSDTVATATAARNLVTAAKETRAAIAFVHHTPLGDDSRMSGGHFDAAVDIEVQVKKGAAGSVAQVVKNNGTDPAEWSRLDYTVKSVEIETPWSIEVEGVVVPSQRRLDLKVAPPKLTADRQLALDALVVAIGKVGEPVTEAAWRAEFKSRAGDRTVDALKVAFRRCRTWLEAREQVIREGDMFRPAGEQQEQGTT